MSFAIPYRLVTIQAARRSEVITALAGAAQHAVWAAQEFRRLAEVVRKLGYI